MPSVTVVNNWNSLPNSVVNATSVENFEKRLDSVWGSQRQKFEHTEAINIGHGNRHLDHNDHTTERVRQLFGAGVTG